MKTCKAYARHGVRSSAAAAEVSFVPTAPDNSGGAAVQFFQNKTEGGSEKPDQGSPMPLLASS
jgi:hypothetical protein